MAGSQNEKPPAAIQNKLFFIALLSDHGAPGKHADRRDVYPILAAEELGSVPSFPRFSRVRPHLSFGSLPFTLASFGLPDSWWRRQRHKLRQPPVGPLHPGFPVVSVFYLRSPGAISSSLRSHVGAVPPAPLRTFTLLFELAVTYSSFVSTLSAIEVASESATVEIALVLPSMTLRPVFVT